MYTKNLSIWKGAVMLDPLLACDPRLRGILINVSCFPTLTSHTPALALTISQTAASIFHHGIPCLGRKYIAQCLTIPPLLLPHSPHTVPQNPLHTSEHSARPLMCPRFPNAKTIFNRFLLTPNTLLRQEFRHELSPFDFV